MRLALVLGVLTGACLGPLHGMQRAAAGLVLVLPDTRAPVRLRLEVTVDGQAPERSWERFLDRLFDWFDRDASGSLSRAEVSALFPLPLPGGKELTPDFVRMDRDGNGSVSRAELKAFCRAQGFGPVIVFVEVADADDRRLAQILLHRLDADGDGKLTRTELRRAPEALRKFDLNEDEYLDRTELLAAAAPGSASGKAQVKLEEGEAPLPILRLEVGTKAPAATVAGKHSPSMRLVTASSPAGLHRLYGPEGRWALAFRTTRRIPDIRSTGDFLVAQLRTALGDRSALSKADLEKDAELSSLLGLLRYADRNGDERLSLQELEDYLHLVDLGMRSQVWVRVREHGHNPFDFLDSDGDGRLSYREQIQAADLLPPDVADVTSLPLQIHLSLGGPSVRSWGGVPIPTLRWQSRPAQAGASPSPAWFRALDRNGDGVLSPREFVGPPEVFRKLDANGDGVLTPDEASRAGSRTIR